MTTLLLNCSNNFTPILPFSSPLMMLVRCQTCHYLHLLLRPLSAVSTQLWWLFRAASPLYWARPSVWWDHNKAAPSITGDVWRHAQHKVNYLISPQNICLNWAAAASRKLPIFSDQPLQFSTLSLHLSWILNNSWHIKLFRMGNIFINRFVASELSKNVQGKSKQISNFCFMTCCLFSMLYKL